MARYIKYVGTSHYREISQADWAKQTPPVDNPTLRWDAANGWTLNADRISEDAWPYIEADPELVIVDKDYRNPEPSNEDSAPADPVYYPPMTTAAAAENIDTRDDVPYGLQPDEGDEYKPTEAEMDVHDAEKAAAAQNDLPDQESGSVEGPVNKD